MASLHLQPKSSSLCGFLCRAPWHQAALAQARALGQWALACVLRAVLLLVRPFALVALRSSVRSRAFWKRGLGASWCASASGVHVTIWALWGTCDAGPVRLIMQQGPPVGQGSARLPLLCLADSPNTCSQ